MIPTTAILISLACGMPQESRPSTSAQKATSTRKAQDALAVFRRFPENKKQTLLRGLLRRVQLDSDPAVQRMVSMQRNPRKLPVGGPPEAHDPESWAEGVAPARTLIESGTPQHDRVRDKLLPVPFLTRMHRGVYYDWGKRQIVRRAKALSPDEQVQNLWNGYPPGADWAVARILDRLNKNKKQQKVGAYLNHLYADLDAKAYEGITLYEAWYSGRQIAVPDVDAIPFARLVLGNFSFKSPIPANKKRQRLYQQIRDHAMRFRIYRTLREAAAASFVSGDPVMDPEYKKLLPRFYYLWAIHDDDLEAVSKLVTKVKGRQGRDQFLAKISKTLENDPMEYRKYELRQQQLAKMARRLRMITEKAILKARDW